MFLKKKNQKKEEKIKIVVIFSASMEIEIRKDRIDEIPEKIADYFDPEVLEMEQLGYFERDKVDANLSLTLTERVFGSKAIIGNYFG